MTASWCWCAHGRPRTPLKHMAAKAARPHAADPRGRDIEQHGRRVAGRLGGRHRHRHVAAQTPDGAASAGGHGPRHVARRAGHGQPDCLLRTAGKRKSALERRRGSGPSADRGGNPSHRPDSTWLILSRSPHDQTETQAIVTLSLMAAFVDGDKHDRERAEVRYASPRAGAVRRGAPAHAGQDVLRKRVDLAGTAAALRSADAPAAYEMAVCVCDADGAVAAEQKFLEQLRSTLGLDAGWRGSSPKTPESVAAAPWPAWCRRRRQCRASACAHGGRGWRGRRARQRRRAGARPDHPQRRHHQRRAGTAAGDAVDHGDHPAADAAGLPHRPGLRLRTRLRARQGFPRHRGRGVDLAVPRTGGPQAAGRAARSAWLAGWGAVSSSAACSFFSDAYSAARSCGSSTCSNCSWFARACGRMQRASARPAG